MYFEPSYQWLWLIIPAGLICSAVLSIMIWRLIEIHRTDLLVTVPLVADQELSIEAAGSMLLHGEGPTLTRAFARLDYQLTDLSNDEVLPLASVWFKTSSSSLSRSRLSLRSFDVGRPGRYRLIVLGLEDPSVADQHTIIIHHDRRRRAAGIIVALVFSAIGLLACFGLSLTLYIINR